jgi:hypothetical protein
VVALKTIILPLKKWSKKYSYLYEHPFRVLLRTVISAQPLVQWNEVLSFLDTQNIPNAILVKKKNRSPPTLSRLEIIVSSTTSLLVVTQGLDSRSNLIVLVVVLLFSFIYLVCHDVNCITGIINYILNCIIYFTVTLSVVTSNWTEFIVIVLNWTEFTMTWLLRQIHYNRYSVYKISTRFWIASSFRWEFIRR